MARKTDALGRTRAPHIIEAGFDKPTGGLVLSARTAFLEGYAS